jgi:cytochrome c553
MLLIVLTLTAGMLAPGTLVSGEDQLLLAAAGERLWTTSPDPANPVACATCHHEAADTRGWAASFPKFKPLPPPHARVMTLLQANAEAVRRHYRVVDPLPVATAITAYLTMHGMGVPLSPGSVAGQPVFPARLRALSQSVGRGRRLYANRCAACHESGTIGASIAAFPRIRGRGAESLEDFLDRHSTPRGRLPWDSPAMADVVSYLVAERNRRSPKEGP